MLLRRIARWSLSSGLYRLTVFPVIAQTDSSAPSAGGGGKFRAACREDVKRFCVGVEPGGGRLVQCLLSHNGGLSPACGNVIAVAGRGAKLRVGCDEDLQRFCAAVQPGGGRLVQCLSSHTGELSTACEDMIAVAGRGGAKLRAACDQDVQRFCVDVQPVRGRLVQCLSSHTSELSAACGNMIAAFQARRDTSNQGAQSPAIQSAAPVTVGNSSVTLGSILRASCGPDVQKLCAGTRRENEALKCLDSQRTELSTTCRLYFQKLGARPTAQENATNKKPSSSPPTPPIPAQENAPPALTNTNHANPGSGECTE